MTKRVIKIMSILISFIVLILLLNLGLKSCLRDDTLSQAVIVDLVNQNQDLLYQVIEEIRMKQTKSGNDISLQNYYREDEVSSKLRGSSSDCTSNRNPVFEKVFKIKGKGIQSISSSKKAERYDEGIWFDCGGVGFATATRYYGFYYCANNTPISPIEMGDIELTMQNGGWSWKEDTGDNEYYTEKICANWYYYEMKF